MKRIERLKKRILPILKKHKVVRAGVFGSYVRGENKKNSDIDILIMPPSNMGFEFVGIKFELEDKLKRKVDLVSYRGLHPLLKNRILKEEVRII